MRSLPLVFLFVVYFVFSEAKTSEEYKDLILDTHNDLRRKQNGANENKLEWSDSLAQKADTWVKRCRFEHESKGYGENLAYNSVDDVKAVMDEAMETWYDEIKMYNYQGKACGMSCHYTQMVWHSSSEIGCAAHKCPNLNAFGRSVNAWFFACWYSPAGNDMSEYPYEKGSPCSKCLEGQTCENGLCVGKGKAPKVACEDKQDYCETWADAGDCDRNVKYMATNCPKSCKICEGGDEPAGSSGPCEDKDANCKGYAFSCQSNKGWMKPNCPKTCGFC